MARFAQIGEDWRKPLFKSGKIMADNDMMNCWSTEGFNLPTILTGVPSLSRPVITKSVPSLLTGGISSTM